MLTCILKRVLPFTLTFIVGAAGGGFVKLFSVGENEQVEAPMPVMSSIANPVAAISDYQNCCYYDLSDHESEPLQVDCPLSVLNQREITEGINDIMLLRATFGADGRVHRVEPITPLPQALKDEASNAAKKILFFPKTLNGKPISVTKEVIVNFKK